jgi:RNA polymerase sigma-70 factor (ECF subfamily)
VKPNLENTSDQELVALTLEGEVLAFSVLVQRHEAAIYRLVRGQTGDPDEAYDLTQDCFAAAYEALGRYETILSMRAWLSRIAINKARDWARRRRVRQFLRLSLPLSSSEALAVEDRAVSPEAALDSKNALANTWRLIAELPRSLREPLTLCTVDELSHAEAAAILRISPKAIEMRIRKARAILKKNIADVGG